MKRWHYKAFITLAVILFIVLGGFGAVNANAAAKTSYADYISNYEYSDEITGEISITGSRDIIVFGSENKVSDFRVHINQSGYYRIAIEYAQSINTNSQITVGVQINGEYPFLEAGEILLPRIFKDSTSIRIDDIGNEIPPMQEPVFSQQIQILEDTNGYYSESYVFYLEKGENIITLLGSGVEFFVHRILLLPDQKIPSYEEYADGMTGEDTKGHYIEIQAENAKYKSDSVLYPNYDRNNVATKTQEGQLNSPKFIKINTIGGGLWKDVGQWISWEFQVPETGYYNIGVKFRQNYLDGLFTSRDIFIDGELLFDGLLGVRFKYDDVWQTLTLSDEMGEPYKIYLTEGSHEIKISCTMGDFSDTLRRLNDSIYEINDLYRRIIMITSTKPDTYTDYFLTERIPDMLEVMNRNKKVLEEEIAYVTQLSGGKGSKTSILETLKIQLGLFIEEPEQITKRLPSFKNNISAMASWLVDIKSQALQLDYLYVKSPDVKTPDADVNFFSKFRYTIQRFLASFHTSLRNEGRGEPESVRVWLNSAAGSNGTGSAGRDQMQVLEDLINESFTAETGIHVNLELVQGSLIEATLAGVGPDVALMSGEDQPVNFAIRGALEDLSGFRDYEEVLERFYPSAIEPFRYEGGLYALPDTQVFNMMFYRTDVFSDLGVSVPDTWSEFYRILPVIQRNNLQITVQDLFPAILFQNGGVYYNAENTKALLDSQTAINAMSTYTDLYTKYGFEVKTDFYSRFRSGELVLSIQPYNMYNQLEVAAPEISGLWAMAPIPGVLTDNQDINRSQNSSVTGTIMFKGAKNKDAAWEFMKWWARDDVKARYGIALEGLMGPSARFTPANKKTLELLPWSETERISLTDAWENVVGIPQIPGSYYTGRGLTNAFRSIVYNSDFPSSAMKLQTKFINEEIIRKRDEFGLTTLREEQE